MNNLIAYKIDENSESANLKDSVVLRAFEEFCITPIMTSEESTTGWDKIDSDVDEETGEAVDKYFLKLKNFLILRMAHTKKMLPKKAITQEVDRRVKELGRNDISRDEWSNIYDTVYNEFNARAVPVTEYIYGYVDIDKYVLGVCTASVKTASLFTNLLRRTLGVLPIKKIVANDISNSFSGFFKNYYDKYEKVLIANDCTLGHTYTLKYENESSVNMKNIGYDSHETTSFLDSGYRVDKLEFVGNDATFKINHLGVVSGIKYSAHFHQRLADDEADNKTEMFLAVSFLQNVAVKLLTDIIEVDS